MVDNTENIEAFLRIFPGLFLDFNKNFLNYFLVFKRSTISSGFFQ